MSAGCRALDALTAESTALFLDFDGTLADIIDDPAAVTIEAATLRNLLRLLRRLDGALAIVTGRDIATLDRFMAPHRFPASGVHGFEWRGPGEEVRRLEVNTDALSHVAGILGKFAAVNDGLLLETKPASIALHYRRRPDLDEACRAAVGQATAAVAALRVLSGHMVFEIKAHAGDKGAAVASFMDTAPFGNRTPVFIGDDVTDEAAFQSVNARAGISIKVGPGPTSAAYRLADAAAVRCWLNKLADKFDLDQISGDVGN